MNTTPEPNVAPKILAFAGSLRKESLNQKALAIAIRGAEGAGAKVTLVNLVDYPMPIYNEDDHQAKGFDKHALKLQGLLTEHDGLLIASPEYNGSLSAALKNAIDWASRPSDSYERSKVFAGKTAAIVAASPGAFGGVRSLGHLRGVLTSLRVIVLADEVAVTFAEEKLAGDTAETVEAATRESLENVGARLAERLKRDIQVRTPAYHAARS